jgi:hypothetical protein
MVHRCLDNPGAVGLRIRFFLPGHFACGEASATGVGERDLWGDHDGVGPHWTRPDMFQ